MADWDNGLPPSGTDVADAEIGDVLINAYSVITDNMQQIASVGMVTQLTDEVLPLTISAVMIDKKEAGRNNAMFL